MSLVPANDQEAILCALGLNPRDPKVQALAVVAQRYGLDLILKQVFLIQGTVYVSHAGLLSLAHRSGDLDGLEVDVREDDKKFVATAKVYRKSMRLPFVYTDECFKNEKVQSPRKRAITRAERNALRRAFDVGVEVWDEDRYEGTVQLSDSRPEIPRHRAAGALPGGGEPQESDRPGRSSRVTSRPESPPPGPPTMNALDAQKSVVIRCREMGLDDPERHAIVWFATKGRTESTKELTPKEAGQIHVLLHDLQRTGEAPWRGSSPTKSSAPSQPGTESPAGTTTKPTEPPPGDVA